MQHKIGALSCDCTTCISEEQFLSRVGSQNNPLVFPSVVTKPPITHVESSFMASFITVSN